MNVAADPKVRSEFTQRLEFAIAQWTAVVPPPLRDAFRAAFIKFAHDHDRALNTIEGIWARRDRSYAFDESTGLARRKPFLDHLAALLADTNAAGPVGVLFLDLNGLKAINDHCGHEAGDRAIAAAGRIIREAIRLDRQGDVMIRSIEDDLAISRHGGDEFIVALELHDQADLGLVAPRIKSRVDDPGRQRACGYDADLPLSVAVGGVVCVRPEHPLPFSFVVHELVGCADLQMYASKRDGLVHVATGHFADRLRIDREDVFDARDARDES